MEPINFSWDACRRGTKETLRVTIERFTSGELITSINMPTRYGKTPTGRLITAVSTKGWRTPEGKYVPPFACVNVWVTVNLILREQAASEDHWNETNKIFSLSQPLRYGEIKDSYDTFGQLKDYARPNGENYLAINIHKLVEDIEMFQRWVDHLIHSTGLFPIFHFDEAHMFGEEKPWGKVIAKLIDAGARIMVWTATPRRSDGGIIPGFSPLLIGSEEKRVKIMRDVVEKDGERYGLFDNIDLKTSDYVLKAHVDIPFTEAWEEGYLLKASYRRVDIKLSEIDGETSEHLRQVRLENLTAATLRKEGIIGKVVRSSKFIREAVTLAYTTLMEWRRVSPKAALVGFTVSDRDGTKNGHAERIKREFLSHDATLKIVVATQKVDDAHEMIKQFEKSDNDIILFKGMGGVGWDCKRIQVVLDLGDDRQDASSIQKWMRGGTPYDGHKAFSLIVPSDKLSSEIFARCVDNVGGAATEKLSELIDQELTKLKDPKERNAWLLNDPAPGSFTDNEAFVADADEAPLAKALLAMCATFRSDATDAYLVYRAKELGLGLMCPHENSKSIDQQIKEKQDDIVSNLDQATVVMYPSVYPNGYDARDWGEMKKYLYRELFKRSGLSGEYIEVRKNRDLSKLTILEQQSQLVLEWARKYAKTKHS